MGEATEARAGGQAIPWQPNHDRGTAAMQSRRHTGPSRATERELRRERESHVYARERGLLEPFYRFARMLTVVLLRGWFRVRIVGTEQIPADGPAILAPNHKNFLDPFFVGVATRRHVRFMAKIELFKGPLAWMFLRLGAFPVRRGEADAEAVETARLILANGGLVVLFPEGTRVEDPDALGSPHHGAGRLALETGAPIVPVAITGTAHLWRGALPKLRRVQLTFLAPVMADHSAGSGDVASALIDDRVWPAVQDEYGRLRAKPGVIVTALAAIGVGGGLLARRRLDAGRLPRLLGRVTPRRQRRHGRLRRLFGRIHILQSTGTALALVLTAASLILGLGGCGSSSASSRATRLHVEVLSSVRAESTRSVSCDAAGGGAAIDAAICAAIRSQPQLLREIAGPQHSCPAGTPTVLVSGSSHGQRVHASFSACVTGQDALSSRWLALLHYSVPERSRPAVHAKRRAVPLLQLGSSGKAVRALQTELARLTYLPSSAVDGVFDMRTWHAVVAFQGWSEITRDGIVGPQTRAALAHAQRPRPWSTATGIEVHIPQQVMLLIAGGRVVRAIHVSTGMPGWPTPVGHFTILSREVEAWSYPFQVWMPLAQFFYSGYAIHEFPDVPDYPASHGCVRVPSEEAETVWRFGRIGMRVWTSR